MLATFTLCCSSWCLEHHAVYQWMRGVQQLQKAHLRHYTKGHHSKAEAFPHLIMVAIMPFKRQSRSPYLVYPLFKCYAVEENTRHRLAPYEGHSSSPTFRLSIIILEPNTPTKPPVTDNNMARKLPPVSIPINMVMDMHTGKAPPGDTSDAITTPGNAAGMRYIPHVGR